MKKNLTAGNYTELLIRDKINHFQISREDDIHMIILDFVEYHKNNNRNDDICIVSSLGDRLKFYEEELQEKNIAIYKNSMSEYLEALDYSCNKLVEDNQSFSELFKEIQKTIKEFVLTIGTKCLVVLEDVPSVLYEAEEDDIDIIEDKISTSTVYNLLLKELALSGRHLVVSISHNNFNEESIIESHINNIDTNSI